MGSAWLWRVIGTGSNTSDLSSEPALESPSASSQSTPVALPTIQAPSDLALERFDFEVVRVNAQGKIINRRPQQAQFFTERLENGTQLEMVAISGGTYAMGSPLSERGRLSHEGPQREVVVSAILHGQISGHSSPMASSHGVTSLQFPRS